LALFASLSIIANYYLPLSGALAVHMKKVLYASLSIIFSIILIIGSVLLYLDRDQKIDFSKHLPNKLTICDKEINEKSAEYIALKTWLATHQLPWNSILVSFAPTYVYYGKDININVNNSAVIVNYSDDGEYKQVVHRADTTEISGKCAKYS